MKRIHYFIELIVTAINLNARHPIFLSLETRVVPVIDKNVNMVKSRMDKG